MAFEIYPTVDDVTKAFPPVVRAAIAQAAEVTGMVDNKITSQFNNGVKPRLDTLELENLAINAPSGFNANSVTRKAVHNISSADNAINMPSSGSWVLLTWLASASLIQLAIKYSVAEPEMYIRVDSSGGWSSWSRTDAGSIRSEVDDLVARLESVENKNSTQDTRLSNIETKNSDQDDRLDTLEEDKWFRGNVASGGEIDSLRVTAARGRYGINFTNITGTPGPWLGHLDVLPNSSDGRTIQRFTRSNGTIGTTFERVYSAGTWSEWEPTSFWKLDTDGVPYF